MFSIEFNVSSKIVYICFLIEFKQNFKYLPCLPPRSTTVDSAETDPFNKYQYKHNYNENLAYNDSKIIKINHSVYREPQTDVQCTAYTQYTRQKEKVLYREK